MVKLDAKLRYENSIDLEKNFITWVDGIDKIISQVKDIKSAVSREEKTAMVSKIYRHLLEVSNFIKRVQSDSRYAQMFHISSKLAICIIGNNFSQYSIEALLSSMKNIRSVVSSATKLDFHGDILV